MGWDIIGCSCTAASDAQKSKPSSWMGWEFYLLFGSTVWWFSHLDAAQKEFREVTSQAGMSRL